MAVPPGPHMDGAYDKMLVKLRMSPDFPLRLLSPYTGFTDDDYRTFRRLHGPRLEELLTEARSETPAEAPAEEDDADSGSD